MLPPVLRQQLMCAKTNDGDLYIFKLNWTQVEILTNWIQYEQSMLLLVNLAKVKIFSGPKNNSKKEFLPFVDFFKP